MKLLFAECCNTLVVPNRIANKIRYCDCGVSCVWWINPTIGELGVYSDNIDKVSVIGLHNGLLTKKCSSFITRADIEEILVNTPMNYLFQDFKSLVIRFQPGCSGDTKFFNDMKLIPLQ